MSSVIIKIPKPKKYIEHPHHLEDAKSRIASYKEELDFVRKTIPELDDWSDFQIICFGDDYARVCWYMSGFQQGAVDRQTWLDLATFIALNDLDLDDPSLHIYGLLESELDPVLHDHIIGQYQKYCDKACSK
ncbi:hypothetical protein ACHJH3_06680 [Campylobacter sp. MOP7]|uniref:hypothetical protein n=1 Tax=Campylobacter canis TaxID=3378588 RepID=UPI00387E3BC2